MLILSRPPTKVTLDPRSYIIQVLKDQKILESNYFYSCLIKKSLPPVIICFSLLISMYLAVKLDCKSLFNTIEIYYVWADAVLSAKFTTGYFRTL